MTPDEVYTEYRRAQDFLDSGRPTEAARIVERVVAAEPAVSGPLELLARAYYDSAQLVRAEEALRRLVAACPDDAWARFALARTLERQHRAPEATEHRRVAAALGHAA